ncbi:hypothetical protein DF186_19920, partial [Enterococcus hirae]
PDSGSFVIFCIIGDVIIQRVLCDIGVSVNFMLFSVMKKFQIEEVKFTRIFFQFADFSIKLSVGVVEDLFVKV